MARMRAHGKEITEQFENIDFKRGITTIEGQEFKIKVTENEKGMYILYYGKRLHITEWDLEQHGLDNFDYLNETGFSIYEYYLQHLPGFVSFEEKTAKKEQKEDEKLINDFKEKTKQIF